MRIYHRGVQVEAMYYIKRGRTQFIPFDPLDRAWMHLKRFLIGLVSYLWAL